MCVFGRNDAVLGKLDRVLIDQVPGARGQPHDRIRGGHFIQEDQGPELANRLIAWARQFRVFEQRRLSDVRHRTLPLYRAYGPEGTACQDAFLSAIAGSNPTPENLEAFELYDVSVADACVKAGDTPRLPGRALCLPLD